MLVIDIMVQKIFFVENANDIVEGSFIYWNTGMILQHKIFYILEGSFTFNANRSTRGVCISDFYLEIQCVSYNILFDLRQLSLLLPWFYNT